MHFGWFHFTCTALALRIISVLLHFTMGKLTDEW
jgi:hypothetical protein